MGEFETAYQAVLRKWPTVEVADLAGPYGTTRVLSSGPPDGPPLVLLPGGGATATAWFANAPALSEAARVHAVDLPGTAGGTAVSVRDAAGLFGWLDSVLDAVAGGPVDLAGHSYGGWVALTYALHAPARVRRLALHRPDAVLHRLPPRLPAARAAGAGPAEPAYRRRAASLGDRRPRAGPGVDHGRRRRGRGTEDRQAGDPAEAEPAAAARARPADARPAGRQRQGTGRRTRRPPAPGRRCRTCGSRCCRPRRTTRCRSIPPPR